MQDIKMQRRRFLATLAASAAAIPLARLAVSDAQAADLPAVTADDAMAKAVGYVTDSSKLDAKKEATYKAGSACGSCALFQGGKGAASGPCPIFPGKAVSAKGWCRSYTQMS
jgi:hypothetical protein